MADKDHHAPGRGLDTLIDRVGVRVAANCADTNAGCIFRHAIGHECRSSFLARSCSSAKVPKAVSARDRAVPIPLRPVLRAVFGQTRRSSNLLSAVRISIGKS
jgi:hypothetical protein